MVGFTFERRLRVAPGGGAGGWWAGPFLGWGRSLGGGALSAAQAGGWWARLGPGRGWVGVGGDVPRGGARDWWAGPYMGRGHA